MVTFTRVERRIKQTLARLASQRHARMLARRARSADRFSRLCGTGTGGDGAFTSPRPIHYQWNRWITVREMARLHGFPDWFRFNETKWHGARQIGNAVPPPLARAVAAQVLQAMSARPTRPKGEIELGEAGLLRMGMADAASYWRIAAPIGRRDRKSGARKRTQAEIEGLSASLPLWASSNSI